MEIRRLIREILRLDKVEYVDYMLDKRYIDIEYVLRLCIIMNQMNLLIYFLQLHDHSEVDLNSLAIMSLMFSSDEVVDTLYPYITNPYHFAAEAYYTGRLKYVRRLLDEGLITKNRLRQYLEDNGYSTAVVFSDSETSSDDSDSETSSDDSDIETSSESEETSSESE